MKQHILYSAKIIVDVALIAVVICITIEKNSWTPVLSSVSNVNFVIQDMAGA